MTPSDRAVVAVVALLAVLSWPLAALASAAGGADTVVITAPGGESRVPVGERRLVTVDGARGPVVVEIGEAGVRVVSAPCPDHLCVRRGSVSGPGASVVCAPSAVTVRIGGGGDAPDALVR